MPVIVLDLYAKEKQRKQDTLSGKMLSFTMAQDNLKETTEETWGQRFETNCNFMGILGGRTDQQFDEL